MGNRVLIFDTDAGWLGEELRSLCPGYEYVLESGPSVPSGTAAAADILCALAPRITPDLVRAMPRLQWIQALTTGVDNLLAMEQLAPHVTITNASGFQGPQMSELAILLMMAAVRRLPQMVANQSSGIWERWPQPLLQGKTACVVGLGVIAEALAERCHAFGMTLIGVSDGRSEVAGFARVFPRAALADAVATADFVVIVVPYSLESHHVVNAGVLNAMKRSAILINISRGGCVDEAALQRALDAGTIAGAALDVFETEPLPAIHPLWSMPNVIVTPHIGGMSDIYAQQVLPIVAQNLTAYTLGGTSALKNRVEREGAS